MVDTHTVDRGEENNVLMAEIKKEADMCYSVHRSIRCNSFVGVFRSGSSSLVVEIMAAETELMVLQLLKHVG